MDDKNSTLLVAAVAVALLAAVLFSIVLPTFTEATPRVVLADPAAAADTAPGDTLTAIAVTPDTVQDMVAVLTRPEQYRRTLTVTLSWQAGGSARSAAEEVETWAEGGYQLTVVRPAAGAARTILLTPDTQYLWYEGETAYRNFPRGTHSSDLSQGIPTYEDVLALEKGDITLADYVQRDGKNCIYIEAAMPRLGQTACYWIETATGLLYAAQLRADDGRTVYDMAETSREIPTERPVTFSLPDGTVLRQAEGR